jgi:hypothetical protein
MSSALILPPSPSALLPRAGPPCAGLFLRPAGPRNHAEPAVFICSARLFCPSPKRAASPPVGPSRRGFFFRGTTEAAASLVHVGCRRLPMLPDRNDSQAEACRPSQEGREIGGRFEASGDEDDRSDNWPRSPIVDWARPRPAREPGLRSAMGPGNGRRPVEKVVRLTHFLAEKQKSCYGFPAGRSVILERMSASADGRGNDVQPGARGAEREEIFYLNRL